MKKHEYLIMALKERAYIYMDWCMDCFSVTFKDDNSKKNYPYALLISEDNRYYFETSSGSTYIDDIMWDGSTPPFTFKERIDLVPSDVGNLQEPANVPVGNLIFNTMVMVHALGNKIPFVKGKVKVRNIESILESRLVDDPSPEEVILPTDNRIFCKEYQTWGDSILQLMLFDSICVPSASPKTLTADPEMYKLRKRLLEENKDRLHDPAVIATIKKQLEEVDRQWVDDWGKDFLIGGGAFNNVRALTFGMFGLEGDELIVNSLSEGWDYDMIDALNNSARSGSIDRSRNTELGGVETKRVTQALQNSNVGVEDCGTTLGIPRVPTPEDKKRYVGMNYIDAQFQTHMITEENVEALYGKVLLTRTPSVCKAEPPDYCAKCVGRRIAETPSGITATGNDFTGRLMYLFMKRMHVSAVALVDYDMQKALS